MKFPSILIAVLINEVLAMPERISIQYGYEKLTTDSSKTFGNKSETMKSWFEGTAGAFDFMTTINKIAKLIGNELIVTKTKQYLDGTAVPRVYTTGKLLAQSLQDLKNDRVINVERGAKIGQEAFDFGAMVSFAIGYFTEHSKQFVNRGITLLTLRDASASVSCGAQIANTMRRAEFLKTASPVLQHANTNLLTNSFLKLVKYVTHLAAGIFSCYAIYMGAALVNPTVAVSIALISSIFSILAYYHKNYWCDQILKVEYVRIQLPTHSRCTA